MLFNWIGGQGYFCINFELIKCQLFAPSCFALLPRPNFNHLQGFKNMKLNQRLLSQWKNPDSGTIYKPMTFGLLACRSTSHPLIRDFKHRRFSRRLRWSEVHGAREWLLPYPQNLWCLSTSFAEPSTALYCKQKSC